MASHRGRPHQGAAHTAGAAQPRQIRRVVEEDQQMDGREGGRAGRASVPANFRGRNCCRTATGSSACGPATKVSITTESRNRTTSPEPISRKGRRARRRPARNACQAGDRAAGPRRPPRSRKSMRSASKRLAVPDGGPCRGTSIHTLGFRCTANVRRRLHYGMAGNMLDIVTRRGLDYHDPRPIRTASCRG